MLWFSNSPYANLDRVPLQKRYLWSVLLPMPVNLGGVIGKVLSFLPEPGVVSVYAIAVQFGMVKMEDIGEMDLGNRKFKFAGKINVEEVEIEFLESNFSLVLLYLRAWWSLIMSREGIYAPVGAYKRDIRVMLLNDSHTPVMHFVLRGCFPVLLPKYSLEYKSSELVTPIARFSVDYVDIV